MLSRFLVYQSKLDLQHPIIVHFIIGFFVVRKGYCQISVVRLNRYYHHHHHHHHHYSADGYCSMPLTITKNVEGYITFSLNVSNNPYLQNVNHIHFRDEFSVSHDVTAAMLEPLNKETAAMLEPRPNPLGIQLYYYANVFFCFR